MNIYQGIINSDEYPSEKNILTCLMVDAEILEYPTLEKFISAEKDILKNYLYEVSPYLMMFKQVSLKLIYKGV